MGNTGSEIVLNNQQIVEIFKEYLTSASYNYAILLNGNWGSGKTHFVKNILFDAVKKDENIPRSDVYVSLFGVKTTDELQNSIFTALVEERAKSLLAKTTRTDDGVLGKLFMKISNSDLLAKLIQTVEAVVGEDGENAKKVVSPWLKYDNHYFVFDDLERCSMNINDTFGYINQFVEQNDAKVLILANENELFGNTTADFELFKIFIAMQSGVNWDKMQIRGAFENTVQKYKQGDIKPKIDEIKWRAENLIDHHSVYKQIKEKLIGRTIIYKPSLYDVAHNIITLHFGEMNFNNDYIDTLVKTITVIMVKQEHHNIRTLQFSMDFFKRIYITIAIVAYGDRFQSIILDVLTSILYVAIAYKDDGYMYNWQEGKAFDSILSRGKEGFSRAFYKDNYFNSFKFVHEYVYFGNFDLNEVSTVITDFKSSLDCATSLNTLRMSGFELDDNTISDNLNGLLQDLNNDQYSSEYKRILCTLFNLKYAGFNLCIYSYVSVMKAKINEGKATLGRWNEPDESIMSIEYAEEYRTIISELNNLSECYRVAKNTGDLNEIYAMKENWGLKFSEYVYGRYPNSYLDFRHDLLSDDCFEQCIEALKNGSASDLSYFQRIVGSVFQYSGKKKDFFEYKEQIAKFINALDFERSATMERFRIRLLRERLESALDETNAPEPTEGEHPDDALDEQAEK